MPEKCTHLQIKWDVYLFLLMNQTVTYEAAWCTYSKHPSTPEDTFSTQTSTIFAEKASVFNTHYPVHLINVNKSNFSYIWKETYYQFNRSQVGSGKLKQFYFLLIFLCMLRLCLGLCACLESAEGTCISQNQGLSENKLSTAIFFFLSVSFSVSDYILRI